MEVYPPFETHMAYDASSGAYLDADRWLVRARACRQVGHWHDALHFLEQGVRLAPEQASLWAELALIYLRFSRYDEALAAYQHIRALRGDEPQTFGGMISLLIEAGRVNQALKITHEALLLWPADARFRYQQGRALTLRKHWREALAAFDYGLTLDMAPSLEVALCMGKSYAHTHLKHYDRALEATQRALQLAPDRATLWIFLGSAYGGLKRYHESLVAFEQAIALTPDDPSAWDGKGRALLRLWRLRAAGSAVSQARRLKRDQRDRPLLLGARHLTPPLPQLAEAPLSPHSS